MNGLLEIEFLEIDKIIKNLACTYAAVKGTKGPTKKYHKMQFSKWSAILKEAIQLAEITWVNNEAVPVYSKKLLATLIKKYFANEVKEHCECYPLHAKEFMAALNGE